MTNLVILISGRGSNMIAIAQACQREAWPARIAAVIAHRADLPGLQAARSMGLPVDVVDGVAFPERAARESALIACIDRHAADIVVLAGYMRILSPEFVRHYAGRMVNIHPSLLPSFPGLHTHRRALEAGVVAHGATVHLVSDALDGGPIIAQGVVPVLPDDDEERLGARVLEVEHRLYPMALRWMVEGRVVRREGRLCVDGVDPRARCLLAPGDGSDRASDDGPVAPFGASSAQLPGFVVAPFAGASSGAQQQNRQAEQ